MDAVLLAYEVMRLPLPERALLVDRLLQSLGMEDDETPHAVAEVAERRLDSFHKGEIQAVDGPSAVSRVRSLLRK